MNIVVIDTETTWSDEVMSIGAVIADADSYQVLDSRYYLIEPECRKDAMYSYVLHVESTPEEWVGSRREVMADLKRWLEEYDVWDVFAYNALFDKKHMPELRAYNWFDIMRIAAYQQYNSRIPEWAPCFKTGRMKSNYGVEPMYRMLSGDAYYEEVHNGWCDAVDELKIMEMMELPIEVYENAKI